MLDIYVMVNWHLSKQGICWPVSHDNIPGSSLEVTEVSSFCQVAHWPGAGFQLGHRLKPGYFIHDIYTKWGLIFRLATNNKSPGCSTFRLA